MVVHTWDEVSEEWATHNLGIESRDPVEINQALGAMLSDLHDTGDCVSPDGYQVEASSWTGPVLTIETRDDEGHLAIIVVIYE